MIKTEHEKLWLSNPCHCWHNYFKLYITFLTRSYKQNIKNNDDDKCTLYVQSDLLCKVWSCATNIPTLMNYMITIVCLRSLSWGGGGTWSHFVYICSDLPLKPLPLKGTIICKKYTLKKEYIYTVKRDNILWKAYP